VLLLGSWLGLAGCGSKDLSDSISTLTSWAATVRLAGEAWVDERVPTPYTRRTFEAAEQGLKEVAKDLPQAEGSTPAARSAALARLRELRRALGEARSAVARKDRAARAAITAPLARIAAEERALRSLGESQGGSGS
jgi:hypothetical protein